MSAHNRFPVGLLCTVGVGVAGLLLWPDEPKAVRSGWGIDACLTRHTGPLERSRYLRLLDQSGIDLLRQRGVGVVETTKDEGRRTTLGGDQLKPEGRRLKAGDIGQAPGPNVSAANWRGDVREEYLQLKRRGYKVVAFAHLPFPAKPAQGGNQLPEDLLMVHRQGQFLGREFAGLVDAWEMVGEPDLGYCTDLPDRVAAYQKALYLGLQRGFAEARVTSDKWRVTTPESGRQRPLVLMGALGLPPSPWLERAARNGLLDYTDAYNFHFYGHAADLSGVIEAHRAFIKANMEQGARSQEQNDRSSKLEADNSKLPLWITECGLKAVAQDDFLNPARRQMQAEFTVATAKQALAAPDVAVFMPFILVHQSDPYALTVSAARPLPAWEAYAKFTRENPWPDRPLARPAHQPNPVVVQWLPDNHTTRPRKVGGTYRFIDGQPIRGEIRIYNFGNEPVKGHLTIDGPGRLRRDRREASERAWTRSGSAATEAKSETTNGHEKTRMKGAEKPPRNPDGHRRLSDGGTEGNLTQKSGSAGMVRRKDTNERDGENTFSGESITDGTDADRSGLSDISVVMKGLPAELEIHSMSMISVPVEITVRAPHYFREWIEGRFIEKAEGGRRNAETSGNPQVAAFRPQVSSVFFGVENPGSAVDFDEEPLPLRALPGGRVEFPRFEPFDAGQRAGVWTTMNGLKARSAEAGAGMEGRKAESEGRRTEGLKSPGEAGASGAMTQAAAFNEAVFWIEAVTGDPLKSPTAVTGIGALPDCGFIRLQFDRPMSRTCALVVTVVDDRGQRYSIWENLGVDYYGSRSDVWLNLEDFHPYIWGRLGADYRFRPERAKELHLRFFIQEVNAPLRVKLSLMTAKRGEGMRERKE